MEVPIGLEPMHSGFAIRRLTNLAKEPKSKEVMAVEGYKSSIYSTRTPYSSVAPLAPSIDYRGRGGTRNQPLKTILSTSAFLSLAIFCDQTKRSELCFFYYPSAKSSPRPGVGRSSRHNRNCPTDEHSWKLAFFTMCSLSHALSQFNDIREIGQDS